MPVVRHIEDMPTEILAGLRRGAVGDFLAEIVADLVEES